MAKALRGVWASEFNRSGGGSHSSHRLNARDKIDLFGRRSLRFAPSNKLKEDNGRET